MQDAGAEAPPRHLDVAFHVAVRIVGPGGGTGAQRTIGHRTHELPQLLKRLDGAFRRLAGLVEHERDLARDAFGVRVPQQVHGVLDVAYRVGNLTLAPQQRHRQCLHVEAGVRPSLVDEVDVVAHQGLGAHGDGHRDLAPLFLCGEAAQHLSAPLCLQAEGWVQHVDAPRLQRRELGDDRIHRVRLKGVPPGRAGA